MATNSLKSIQYQSSLPLRRRHSIDIIPSSLSSSNFLKNNQTTSSLSTPTTLFSISPVTFSSSNTISSTSSQLTSLDLLSQHLSSQNFREADEETRRLIIALAGESAQKRGYVFFSEVQFIPEADLKAIDELWRQHSDNKFGYSVQKRIWEKVNKDFSMFFIKVGWMKKLDTEIEQHNYRSFPSEFMWELKDETPEGHLPLTNALRGTQLLNCILSHPAFKNVENANDKVEDNGDSELGTGNKKALTDSSKTPSTKRAFKPDYSF